MYDKHLPIKLIIISICLFTRRLCISPIVCNCSWFYSSLYAFTSGECPLRHGNNTLKQIGRYFADHIFLNGNFQLVKFRIFHSNYTCLCYWGFDGQRLGIGSANGFALTRRQRVTSINVDEVFRCQLALQAHNEFTCSGVHEHSRGQPRYCAIFARVPVALGQF